MKSGNSRFSAGPYHSTKNNYWAGIKPSLLLFYFLFNLSSSKSSLLQLLDQSTNHF